MSFDGIFLSRLIKEFNILKTGRISKVIESGDTDFILTIRANRQNYNLMMSFSSDFSRIHLTNKEYNAPANPKSFTMFLRKHIEGYFVEDINIYHSDRIVYFTLTGYNEMQDFKRKYLICEVMGRYSNMILADQDFKIIEAIKHDGVGEYNRTILPNAIYEFPETNKLNPLNYTCDELINIAEERRLSNPKEYMNAFNGVSLNLSYPIFNVEMHSKAFYEYLHIDNKPCTFINFKGKLDFYYHPFNNEVIDSYNTLSELLDEFYYKADIQAKVKLKTNDLLTFINRQINKNKKKIEKLHQDKEDANRLDEYRIYGELLLSAPNLKEKKKEIKVFNYYDNENIIVPLDIKYSIIENSNRYFKKYQKSKTSLLHIDEQIKIAENEIEYFDVLKYQLEAANINEAMEIQEELIEGKYIFKKDNKPRKKQKPKLLTYSLDNGTLISVGKNNIQNEYLTHKLAKGNEMWFHIKDGAGSHVVIHNEGELTEEEIRTAANLAAYYSTMSESSSVAVDYTKIRNIKKIPGKRNCFVTYTHQKTIYIDPDKDYINELKVKK
ncbi:MAG: fibronectin-binding domain-containing protein [Erysipelotrichaceae bacterium]|nr:fibronectin-binding domain-containing protein [Erysipelotrichaceae bacterium]